MRARADQSPAALSRSSPEPLYRQLAGVLERTIRSGGLKPGDRLDSETVLTARYGVSRITLRQAVQSLVRKQILVRKQGKGTFVTAPAVRHDLKRLHGLLGSLFSQAEGASARLLRYELRVPSSEISDALGTRPREKALYLERLYLIDSTPVAMTEAWLVPAVAALPRAKAELISTEDMMLAVGIRIASTEVVGAGRGGRCGPGPAVEAVAARAGSRPAAQGIERRRSRDGGRARVVLLRPLRAVLLDAECGRGGRAVRYPERCGARLIGSSGAFC